MFQLPFFKKKGGIVFPGQKTLLRPYDIFLHIETVCKKDLLIFSPSLLAVGKGGKNTAEAARSNSPKELFLFIEHPRL